MAKWTLSNRDWDVEENAMVVIATDAAGLVKKAHPFAGDPNNDQVLKTTAVNLAESVSGVRHVMIVPARYVLTLSERKAN